MHRFPRGLQAEIVIQAGFPMALGEAKKEIKREANGRVHGAEYIFSLCEY